MHQLHVHLSTTPLLPIWTCNTYLSWLFRFIYIYIYIFPNIRYEFVIIVILKFKDRYLIEPLFIVSWKYIIILNCSYIYMCIYIYICVCVCVREREREKGRAACIGSCLNITQKMNWTEIKRKKKPSLPMIMSQTGWYFHIL